MNGVRVFWDGHTLLTAKQKTTINMPPSIINLLPSIPFEAQLCSNDSLDWHRIKLQAFDAPTRWSDTYEERIKLLRESARSSPIFSVVNPIKVNSLQQVDEMLQHRNGVIFRKPGSKYLARDSFFKLEVRNEIDVMVASLQPLTFVEYVNLFQFNLLVPMVVVTTPQLHLEEVQLPQVVLLL